MNIYKQKSILEVGLPVDKNYTYYGLRMCDLSIIRYFIWTVYEFCAILLPCLVLELRRVNCLVYVNIE